MSIFRSEEMGLFTLGVDKNAAWDVVESLGRLSCLHFIDVNTKEQVYNRIYSAMTRRCDEGQRRVRYLEAVCEQYKKPLVPPKNVNSFLASIQEIIANKGKNSMAYFEEIESTIESAEKFLLVQQKEAERLFLEFTAFAQQKYVLNKASEIVLARSK